MVRASARELLTEADVQHTLQRAVEHIGASASLTLTGARAVAGRIGEDGAEVAVTDPAEGAAHGPARGERCVRSYQ